MAKDVITPLRQQRSQVDLLTHYFEVNFDEVAEELAAAGPGSSQPADSVRRRELAASRLREFIRALMGMRGSIEDEAPVFELVSEDSVLAPEQRELLRSRIQALLHRVEAGPPGGTSVEVIDGIAAADKLSPPAQFAPDTAVSATADEAIVTTYHPTAEDLASPSTQPAPVPPPWPSVRTTTASSAVASVLHALTGKGLEELDADLCQVFLEEDDTLALRAESPPEAGEVTGPRNLGWSSGFASKMRAHGEPLALTDTRDLVGTEHIWLDRGLTQLAGVRIGDPEEPGSGVLVVARAEDRPFSPGDLDHLAQLAAEVALALASADLLSRAEELAVLKERMKLAREIHDGLASDLSAVVALFKYHQHRREADPADADRILGQMQELVEGSLQSARDILATLRPRQQVPRKLVDAVRRHVEDFAQTYGITAVTRIQGDDQELVTEERDAIYQILREALTNVRKHSEAGTIDVSLDLRRRPFTLVVEDDGTGIDLDVSEDKAGSFGITGMRERAELLGGWIEIGNGAMGGVRLAFHGPELPLGTG